MESVVERMERINADGCTVAASTKTENRSAGARYWTILAFRGILRRTEKCSTLMVKYRCFRRTCEMTHTKKTTAESGNSRTVKKKN